MKADKPRLVNFMQGGWALALSLILTWGIIQKSRAEAIPEAAYLEGFVGHAQSYALSCESRSAVDWMAYWGIYASETDFQSGLPGSDNPDAGFVGNPNDLWGGIPPGSYGVHAGPVAAQLRAYGFQAEGKRGWSWDELRSEIAAGRPVIVWVIGQMWRGVPQTYTSTDGESTTVASFEHTMVLVGYDSTWVYVVDAFSGQNQAYAINTFLKSWEVLENMAVTGSLETPSQPAEQAETPAEAQATNTYTVQRGDYLVELASRFGTDWRELATLNNIAYPFTIYTGQVLQIPSGAGSGEISPPPEPVEEEPTATPEVTLTETPPPPPTSTPEPTVVPATPDPAKMIERLFLPSIDNLSEPAIQRLHGMPRQIFR